jgi:hypothetical protein
MIRAFFEDQIRFPGAHFSRQLWQHPVAYRGILFGPGGGLSQGYRSIYKSVNPVFILTDVFSTELGIGLSFVKTSEFRRGVNPQTPPPSGTPLARTISSTVQINRTVATLISLPYIASQRSVGDKQYYCYNLRSKKPTDAHIPNIITYFTHVHFNCTSDVTD